MELLVTLFLALHFGYLAFLVLGGFFAWRWPRAIWVHLAAVGWGLLIVVGVVNCPLTWAEDRAREATGQPKPTVGFVDRFLDGVIYPERYVNLARAAVALVVLISWIGAWWLHKRRSDRKARHDGESPRKSEGASGHAATV